MAIDKQAARELIRNAVTEDDIRIREATDIAYPSGGVSEFSSFSSQEPGTSRDERNMRSFDVQTGRLRGAQRAGLGRYDTGSAIAGGKKIAELASVMREVNPFTWAYSNNARFSLSPEGSPTSDNTFLQNINIHVVTDIRRDLFGTFYILSRLGLVQKVNPDGTVVEKINAPVFSSDTVGESLYAETVAVDNFQNVFIGVAHRVDRDAELNAEVVCMEYLPDGSYRLAWTVAPGMFILDMYVYATDLFVWGVTAPETNVPTYKLIRYSEYVLDEAPTPVTQSTFETGENDAAGITQSAGSIHDLHVGRMDVDDTGEVYATASRYRSSASSGNAINNGKHIWSGIWKLRPISTEANTAIWHYSYDGDTDHYGGTKATGSITFPGPTPDNTTTVTITDSSLVAKTFEFHDDQNSVTAGNVWINTSSPTLVVSNLNAQINLQTNFNIDATLGSALVVNLTSTVPGAGGNQVITEGGPGTDDINILGMTGGADSDNDHQGYGLGVMVAPDMPEFGLASTDRRIWVWGGGPQGTTPDEDQPRVRLVKDVDGSGLDWDNALNLSFDLATGTPSRGWVTDFLEGEDGSYLLDQIHNRGAIDEDGRLYLPYAVSDEYSVHDQAGGTVTPYLVIQPDTAVIPAVAIHADPDRSGVLSSPRRPSCVAVPLLHPGYNDDDIQATDFVVVGGQSVHNSGDRWVYGSFIVEPTGSAAALREIRTLAFSNGFVWKLRSGLAAVEIQDKWGANVTYDTAMEYIQAASGLGHIYYSDGMKYYDYNPKDDLVSELVSGSIGEIPKRCRLIEVWRNRLVLARSDELPGSWHMSRAGHANDWDLYPAIGDSAGAVSGITSPAGAVPDSINAIVPYSNDLLWFGCDSSIWQLTGSPASAEFDMVTDEVGMSFGRPYCKDDAGALWFFGSKGGLYTWSNGLVDVAKGRVRRRFRDIDLGANYIRLVYNYADDGIHIFVCPFGDAASSPKEHYFYDKRTGAFHIDKFGSAGDFIEPTAAMVVDGDLSSDRAIMLGSGNGHIHRWGVDELGNIPKSDHKTTTVDAPIDSYVLIGPLAPVEDVTAAALSELTVVLADGFAGAHAELFVTNNPDVLGDPVWHSELEAGRNAGLLCRVSGDSMYLRLRNSKLDSHWALERAAAFLSYGGRVRK